MINGVLLAGGGFWAFLAPTPQVQVALLVVISAMTVEMALGFAVTVLLYRSREVDMVDMATDLSG
jgi:NAD(P)H-quinone oxidoreductase subunit 4L